MNSKLDAGFRVHVVISDRGWILERCARQLAERLSYVSYGLEPDLSADVQYYVTYSTHRGRVSPVEIAFFTHLEKDEGAAAKFFSVAASVDHRVVMASRYARLLDQRGLNSRTIEPGFDAEKFKPLLRIGIVGRTYHTGRKGEELLQKIIDVPGIDWRFCGAGWPGQSRSLSEDELPGFYNDLDYVLVPSLVEGGPMSALEAIACGRPVIASDVGWMDRLPHIAFENGNAEDLRRVLVELVAQRSAARATVLPFSWENWAARHHELFVEAVGASRKAESAPGPIPDGVVSASGPLSGKRISIVLHGAERSLLGGPSIRGPETAARLRSAGINACSSFAGADHRRPGEVAHVFNIWPPDSAKTLIGRLTQGGSRIVLSPIYLDLSEWEKYSRHVPRILRDLSNDRSVTHALDDLAGATASTVAAEPVPGYRDAARAIAEATAFLVFLSEFERRAVAALGVSVVNSQVIRNAVDHKRFAGATGKMFEERFGIRDYLLCVGRIEPRKNQALLAKAVAATDLPLVFIGHSSNDEYANIVRALAGPRTVFVPRIEPNDPLLASAFAGASAFCLPSFAEGAPLAALEAAAAGVPLVLSDRSGESEYFGSLATYVSPLDLEGLRDAVVSACQRGRDSTHRDALKRHAEKQFDWDPHIEALRYVYERVARDARPHPHMQPPRTGPGWTVDLTTSLHHTGTPSGIVRVEKLILQGIFDSAGAEANAVAWNSQTNTFRNLTWGDAYVGNFDSISAKRASDDHIAQNLRSTRDVVVKDHYLVFGGAWIRNERYVAALAELRNDKGVRLCILIHDIAQHKMRNEYGIDTGAVFEGNLRSIVRIADVILTYSKATRDDVVDYCASQNLPVPRIEIVRLGDVPLHKGSSEQPVSVTSFANQDVGRAIASGYVLYVSAIDVRKNHRLLFDLWRRLIAKHGPAAPHLLLVGRMGWGSKEIMADLDDDRALSERVLVLPDVGDDQLDFLYRNARFTVYPSLMEGWGLPVAESLLYGKVCVASAASSIPEIAPKLCDLIDPLDSLGWFERIERYAFDPDALSRRSKEIEGRYVERGWDAYAAEIVSVLSASRWVPARSVVTAESAIGFGKADGAQFSGVSAGGWWGAEDSGRWMSGEDGVIVFDLMGRSELGWTVRAVLSTLGSVPARKVDISVNGSVVGQVDADGTSTEYFLPVPRDVLDGDAPRRQVRIRFFAKDAFRPCDVIGGNDKRLLSIFVRSVTVSRTREAGAGQKAIRLALPQTPPKAAPPKAALEEDKAHLLKRAEIRFRRWRRSLKHRIASRRPSE